MNEIELKLEIDAGDADKLLASGLFQDAAAKDLTSVYFDTPTHRLRKAGFSLRVRHAGERRIQTIKADGAATAGLFVRPEWEQDIAGDLPVLELPDQPLAEQVGRKVLARIKPAFRTQIDRSLTIARLGDATVELVLDRGRIVGSGRVSSVCEVELELRDGAPGALFGLARRLDETAAVRLGVLSKSERGYRLVDGSGRHATKSQPVALSADATAATAFQAIAAACIRQFRLNETLLVETGDPEALHQARVGLRRLRSALSLFKPIVKDGGFDRLRGELRWISAVLGEARDIDVLVRRFSADDIVARLHEAKEVAYANVREALASARSRHLMLDLSEWLALGDWTTTLANAAARDEPVLRAAAAMLDRHRKRVKQRGADFTQLDDEARHELRIEAKKLRYATEFFTLLYSGKKELRRSKLFRDALEELQEQLGELNDLATMPLVLDRLGIADAAADVPAGRRSSLLRKAGAAHDALVDARRFWR